MVKLNNTTSKEVIGSSEAFFAHHGIIEILLSDNSPQYSSESVEMKEFASIYGSEYIMSSPTILALTK